MQPEKKIVLIDTIHPVFNSLLEKQGFEITDGTLWTKPDFINRVMNYNGIAIRSRFKIDQAALKDAMQLRFIARAGAGMENIDVSFAASRNIHCLNAPEGNRDAVGEHAIGMLLSLFNHLNRADAEVRNGIWKREENRGTELQGKTVGVIGYGNMGAAFVRKLEGFDVSVLVYDKYKDFMDGTYYKKAGMEQMYESCDIISLHIPLTSETHYLVNDEMIGRFKKNIYFINTSRGQCIQTADLVKNIKTGKISGACLDVIEYESLSFENINMHGLPEPFQYLIASDKVILSPHIAGWTQESNYKIAVTLAQKIIALYDKS